MTAEQPDTPGVLHLRRRAEHERSVRRSSGRSSLGAQALTLDEALALSRRRSAPRHARPGGLRGRAPRRQRQHRARRQLRHVGGHDPRARAADRDRRRPGARARGGDCGSDGSASTASPATSTGGMKALDRAPRPRRPARANHRRRRSRSSSEAPTPPLVLDVRTEREWREDRIEGSLNVPALALARTARRGPARPRGRALLRERLPLLDRRQPPAGAAASRTSSTSSAGWGRGGRPARTLRAAASRANRPRAASAERPGARGLDARSRYNAETPLELLCRTTVTPTELFFVRNHGPVPEVDPSSYRLTVDGLVARAARPCRSTTCARFERVEVDGDAPVRGQPPQTSSAPSRRSPARCPGGRGDRQRASGAACGCRDVLEAAGLEVETGHVAFTGLDEVEEEGELLRFGGSIPLEKALRPNVLLADEMNGEPLPPVHGYPLRVVVPGYDRRAQRQVAVDRSRCSASPRRTTSRPAPTGSSRRTCAPRPIGERGYGARELPASFAVCGRRRRDARRTAVAPRLRAHGRAAPDRAGRGLARRRRDAGRAPSSSTSGPAGSWRLWQARARARARALASSSCRAWDSAASTQPESAAGSLEPQGLREQRLAPGPPLPRRAETGSPTQKQASGYAGTGGSTGSGATSMSCSSRSRSPSTVTTIEPPVDEQVVDALGIALDDDVRLARRALAAPRRRRARRPRRRRGTRSGRAARSARARCRARSRASRGRARRRRSAARASARPRAPARG